MLNAIGNPIFTEFIKNLQSQGLHESNSEKLFNSNMSVNISENNINCFKILKFFASEMMDIGNYNEYAEGTLID